MARSGSRRFRVAHQNCVCKLPRLSTPCSARQLPHRLVCISLHRWWGNQDGGWGRDAGVTVFAADSGCGNGRVEVTAHPASPLKKRSSSSSSGTAGGSGSSFAPPPGSWEEWRVLRFNGVTRQTVMRVHVAPGGDGSNGRQQLVLTQPDCLAQEYLKTTAAVAAALLALQHLLPRSSSGSSSNGSGGAGAGAVGGRRPRTLCIGVGGGSLPLFLAHHFPCMGACQPRGNGGCEGADVTTNTFGTLSCRPPPSCRCSFAAT